MANLSYNQAARQLAAGQYNTAAAYNCGYEFTTSSIEYEIGVPIPVATPHYTTCSLLGAVNSIMARPRRGQLLLLVN
jgi:hypothetical protein